jgi:L-malate glycosyltransferase
MKIMFIGNMKDIHTPKWMRYFSDICKWECIPVHFESFFEGLMKKSNIEDTIKVHDPDIIHAHYAGAWGLICALVKPEKTPFIVTIHGSEVLLTRGLKKRLVEHVLRKADIVTTDSLMVKVKAEEMGAKDVRLIHFGVDTKKYVCDPLKRRASLYKSPIVVYRTGPGRVYDEKTMLRAIESVHEFSPDIQFVPLRGYDEPGLIDIFSRAWLYVSTAISDAGLASTTAEAMSCSLPVIVTDVAVNRRWVDHGKKYPIEQIFAPGDSRWLATGILNLLMDEGLRHDLGILNRKRIELFNDYYCEMEKMKNIYEEVGNGR